MTDVLERLRPALADRYAIERELGRGGMAFQRGQRRAPEGGGGGLLQHQVEMRFTVHRTPHTAP